MIQRKIYNPVFLLPAVALYTIFFIIPVVSSIGFSFTDWNTLKPKISFIGLENYISIIRSDSGPYLQSLINTILFTVVTVILKTLCGLFLAVMLNRGFRGKNILRTLFFSTYTLSPLIIGIVFVSLLSGSGPLNAFLISIGLESLVHSWLSEPGTALPSTMAVEVWRMAGWNMIIFLAGLQMISKDYYEAADIDGANEYFKFVKITIPFLLPSITVAIVLNTIHGLKVFEIIYALTGGGPGSLTEVINTQVYREFADGHYGMSNALAVIVFIITSGIALYMRKVLSGEESE